jgi:hypothetical protein
MRPEPPPSVPTASGPRPAATATAAPPLDPPEVRLWSQALAVRPKSGASVNGLWPNSGVVVLPIRMAPARFNRATATESVEGTLSAKATEPKVVRTLAVSTRSLIENGTPKSGLRTAPCIMAASASRAAARASSAVTVIKAFSTGCARSMRSRTTSTSSTGDNVRPAISRASSAAEVKARSLIGWS